MKYNHKSRWLLIALCSAVACRCMALEPEQIWELVSPSCVRIEATQLDGTKTLGTGFAFEIDGKKYILSNRHVVLGASRVQIGHSATNLLQAPSYRICPSLDFAIIDVPQKFTIAAAKKRQSPLKTGERAYAIGFPLGLNKSITQGLVNSHSEEYVQFDAPISSGNSGGPLVDKDGAVIGVVTGGALADAGELVQNLNLAINIAYVPKARVFVDPIVSFYDAWRRLVEYEARLIADVERFKVLEVQQYLYGEMAVAVDSWDKTNAPQSNPSVEKLQAMRELLLKPINESYKDVDSAVASTVAFLRGKVSEFDEIPKLFAGVGRQKLLEQFLKDKRPQLGLVRLPRLNIEMADIVPLLTVSLEHVKAKYEDVAYQISFLGRIRTRLEKRDPALLAQLRTLDAKASTLHRNTVRISYPAQTNLPSEEIQLQYFIHSMMPFAKKVQQQQGEAAKPGRVVKLTPEEEAEYNRLDAEQEFTRSGGFQEDILGMFQRLAIEQNQQNHLDQALGFIRNETAHRKFPAWRIEAHVLVCQGEFEAAYKTYEKALYTSEKQFDPFTLERRSGMTDGLILDEVSAEQDGFWSYPKPIQANWREWNRFIFSKGGLSMGDAASPQEIFASQAFAGLSQFEKARIIYRIQKHSRGNKLSEFFKAVRDNPASREVDEKYF